MKLKKEIEKIFSNDLSSPSFPILASCYYDDKDYNKAIKVCKIGLNNDPKNYVGQYIYAKSLIMIGEFVKAESLLKGISVHNVFYLRALLLLIEVMQHLNRSSKSITKYINQISWKFPNHPQLQELIKIYKIKSPSVKNKVVFDVSKNNKEGEQANYDIKLATKTMYQLLISQKQYHEALKILNVMLENNYEINFASKEKKKIQAKLKKEKASRAKTNR